MKDAERIGVGFGDISNILTTYLTKLFAITLDHELNIDFGEM